MLSAPEVDRLQGRVLYKAVAMPVSAMALTSRPTHPHVNPFVTYLIPLCEGTVAPTSEYQGTNTKMPL